MSSTILFIRERFSFSFSLSTFREVTNPTQLPICSLGCPPTGCPRHKDLYTKWTLDHYSGMQRNNTETNESVAFCDPKTKIEKVYSTAFIRWIEYFVVVVPSGWGFVRWSSPGGAPSDTTTGWGDVSTSGTLPSNDSSVLKHFLFPVEGVRLCHGPRPLSFFSHLVSPKVRGWECWYTSPGRDGVVNISLSWPWVWVGVDWNFTTGNWGMIHSNSDLTTHPTSPGSKTKGELRTETRLDPFDE